MRNPEVGGFTPEENKSEKPEEETAESAAGAEIKEALERLTPDEAKALYERRLREKGEIVKSITELVEKLTPEHAKILYEKGLELLTEEGFSPPR